MGNLPSQVLDNPAFKEAFEQLRADYLADLVSSDISEDDLKVKLLRYQILEEVQSQLEAMLNG